MAPEFPCVYTVIRSHALQSVATDTKSLRGGQVIKVILGAGNRDVIAGIRALGIAIQVELGGFEPPTSSLRTRRSAS
jgi:hypothetical protein